MTATVTDKLISKAKELGLPPQTEGFLRQADTAVTDAVRRAGTYTNDNRAKIADVLDKAGRVVDEKTQGKYAHQIVKVRAQADKGLDKLAEKAAARTDEAKAAGAADSGLDLGEDSGAAVPPKPVWAQATDPSADHGTH